MHSQRYADLPALRFEQADVTALDHLPDAGFDVIVSFETLEHVEAQERMLAGFRRLLAPGGLLLISSPDKRTYSDLRNYRNEFHVRELYREQLEALLHTQFPAVRILRHRSCCSSRCCGIPMARRARSECRHLAHQRQSQFQTRIRGAVFSGHLRPARGAIAAGRIAAPVW